LILAAVPYRVIFLSLKTTDVFVSILAVELVYKILAYPLRLSSFGQRLQECLAQLCTKKFVESATNTFSTLSQPKSPSADQTQSSPSTTTVTDADVDVPGPTGSSSVSQTIFPVPQQPQSHHQQPAALTLSPLSPAPERVASSSDVDRVPSRGVGLTLGGLGTPKANILEKTEDPAVELSRRFFVHNMVDLTAILSVTILLQLIRWVDPSSAIGSVPSDDWSVILYHYLIAIAFEVVLIASFTWGMSRFINERFTPFAHGREIVGQHLTLFFSLQLVAYLITFLVLDTRNQP